jgi:hypothetical protein
MVKMNTTLKHKKKNNVKKNSNKNKSNKNKKTTRQKKYYRKRKYSRKMKGGRVCFKNDSSRCLKVVAKYGDASSENKTTTTNIDGNKNVITLTPVALTPVDSQIVVVDDGSGAIQTSDDVINTGNTGLKNVDTEKTGVENVDLTTSITPGSDTEVSENLDAEKTGIENVVVDQNDDKTTSLVDSSVVNAGEEIQENVFETEDNTNPLVDSSLVNVGQGIQENVDLTQDNINRPPTPPPPLGPRPPKENNIVTDLGESMENSKIPLENKSEILVDDNKGKLFKQLFKKSLERRRSSPSILTSRSEEPKENTNNVSKKVAKEVAWDQKQIINNKTDKDDENTKINPQNTVVDDYKDDSVDNFTVNTDSESDDGTYVKSDDGPAAESEEVVDKESGLVDPTTELIDKNKTNHDNVEVFNFDDDDDWGDNQGGKTRRRRSIKKNKKNSKSKKQSKKMRKNKKTRK